MSTLSVPRNSPVSPPIVKTQIAPMMYHIGVLSRMLPLYIVASQLKTLTADGTATLKVIRLKSAFASGLWPLVNMWWPQTTKLNRAMLMLDRAMKL